MSHTLLLVGAGRLAEHIAAAWRELYAEARIIGKTRTTSSHDRLKALGIEPSLVSEEMNQPESHPSFVVFCAPVEASTTAAYVPQLSRLVSRLPETCRMVYTSSGSVHGETTEAVTETTRHGTTARAKLLSSAETTTLSRKNAAVIRLSALYDDTRGPHCYMTRSSRMNFPSYSLMNVVHYADVAQAVVKLLTMPREQLDRLKHRTFIAAGTRSITAIDLCKLAVKLPGWTDCVIPEFVDGPVPSWKQYDGRWTMETLSWRPRFPTFGDYVAHKLEEQAE